MKSYLKFFGIPFIITIVVVAVCVVIGVGGSAKLDEARNNEYFDNTDCVWDLAEKMTDSEVKALNARIMKWEEKCHADILWITICDDENAYLNKVKALADEVAEGYGLGYEGPGGSAIVFIDNWSRGGDGKIHTWISTTGSRIRSDLTDSEVEEILNILDEIPNDAADPYEQYAKILDKCGKQTSLYHPFPIFIPFIAGLIVAGIFILVNWRSKLGDVTVTSTTYLKGGKAQFPVARDVFRNKTVTSHKIERSSGGGGGGGGSHGGGGHSR